MARRPHVLAGALPQPAAPKGAERSEAEPEARTAGRRREAGIYGTVITAAVLAVGGNHLAVAPLAVTVVVTLAVYWLAEQYAALLAEHTRAGRLPTAAEIRSSLGATWPMVTASFVPVGTLLLARLFRASSLTAAEIALGVAIVLLVWYGYAAGRAADLHGMRLGLVTGLAGLLGVALVALKVLLEHHG